MSFFTEYLISFHLKQKKNNHLSMHPPPPMKHTALVYSLYIQGCW